MSSLEALTSGTSSGRWHFFFLLNPELPENFLPVLLIPPPALRPSTHTHKSPSPPEHPQHVNCCRETGWRTAADASKSHNTMGDNAILCRTSAFPQLQSTAELFVGSCLTTRHASCSFRSTATFTPQHREARLASMQSSNWSQTLTLAIAALKHFKCKWRIIYFIGTEQ